MATHAMNRRGFLLGLLAAPAIVRASSLMPVRALLELEIDEPFRFTGFESTVPLISESLMDTVRRTFVSSLLVQIHKPDPMLRRLIRATA